METVRRTETHVLGRPDVGEVRSTVTSTLLGTKIPSFGVRIMIIIFMMINIIYYHVAKGDPYL